MKAAMVTLTAGAIFLCVASLYAETGIKAEVDKTKIASNELLTYKLIVHSSEKKALKPKMSDFKGFSIVSQAQSSSVSFAGGKTRVVNVFVFMLGPREPGTFIIAPATITAKGKEYSSESFEIHVLKDAIPRTGHLPEAFPETPAEESPDLSGPKITL